MSYEKNSADEKIEVLVAEDSPTQAERLKYLLKQHGYRVESAANGKEALVRLETYRPILVISDIIMPEMNGYQLCEHIKADRRYNDIPVILLTSLTSPEDVLEGLACGADSFITKPYSEKYLLSNIEQILANRRLRKNERVRIGVEIMFAGKTRFITADQQQMLSLLISTYEAAVHRNRELIQTQDELRSLNERLEELVEERTDALSKEVLERKHSEEREKQLNNVLRAIRGVNQLITREKNRERLIQEACTILTSTRGFNSVWIVLVDENGEFIQMAESGMKGNHHDLMERMQRGEWPRCATRALAGPDPVLITDPTAECRDCPLVENYSGYGALATRFEQNGKVFGLMVASLAREMISDKDEQELFKEVAGDIAFSLYSLMETDKRAQTEAALQESEDRFKILFEYAPDAFYLYNLKGEFLDGNRAAEDLSGFRKEELIGKSFFSTGLLHEDLEKVSGLLEKSAKGLPTGPDELIIHQKEGTQATIETRTFPLKLGEEDIVLAVARDISERKSLEEQLRQSQKMEAIGRLAGGIAHDFNNLLTTIIGNAEMGKMDLNENEPLYDVLNEISGAGERAASLTRQLLAFSRKQILQLTVINLNETLQDMDKMLRRIIGEDIDLKTSLAPDLGQVEADIGQIEQVVMNLVVNARDAMPGGGRLTIETANIELDAAYTRTHGELTTGPYVVLAVSDTGVGLDPELQERIFEPFFTTKEKGKGTGLGLSTVYGIVKQSNGNIWVYSEPGQGTTFKICLPRVEKSTPTARRRNKEKDAPSGTETILVVEDDETVRDLAAKLLKGYGYTVLPAESGDEAVRMFREYQGDIHLILTDVVMPGMSSRELEAHLKQIRPDIKVIYMSGYTDNSIVHHGILDPQKAFLQKPFTPAGLACKVRQVLDS